MRTGLRSAGFVALVTLAAAACASEPAASPTAAPTALPTARPTGDPGESPTTRDVSPRAQIYAAVIRQLVTVDHTFGQAPSPFERVYVVDGVLPEPQRAPWPLAAPRRRFPRALKAAIADHLGDLPQLEFIPDPDPVREDLVAQRGVIIGLGPIGEDWSRRRVAASLWCGDLCGLWLSYILTEDDGLWTITDRAGPHAVA